MLVNDVEACSFDQWYRRFSKVTFASFSIPIPDDVLQYLRSDGTIVLPAECEDEEEATVAATEAGGESDDDSANGDGRVDWSEQESDKQERPSFASFHVTLKEKIRLLGGSVFVKLNWSAPKDAAWIGLGNSLRCSSPSEIWLLLKSSDFVAHDLTQPYKDTDDILTKSDFSEPKYSLVLRKWHDINPGNEFRCFVRDWQLFAVCQRDPSHFYEHVAADRESILTDIRSFFDEHVQHCFPLSRFVFDVVRRRKDHVLLVDFNPFGITTDPILFDWPELEQMQPDASHIEFRCVDSDAGIQPSQLRHYALPRDMVDMASGVDHHKFLDFIQLQTQMQQSHP